MLGVICERRNICFVLKTESEDEMMEARNKRRKKMFCIMAYDKERNCHLWGDVSWVYIKLMKRLIDLLNPILFYSEDTGDLIQRSDIEFNPDSNPVQSKVQGKLTSITTSHTTENQQEEQ